MDNYNKGTVYLGDGSSSAFIPSTLSDRADKVMLQTSLVAQENLRQRTEKEFHWEHEAKAIKHCFIVQRSFAVVGSLFTCNIYT